MVPRLPNDDRSPELVCEVALEPVTVLQAPEVWPEYDIDNGEPKGVLVENRQS